MRRFPTLLLSVLLLSGHLLVGLSEVPAASAVAGSVEPDTVVIAPSDAQILTGPVTLRGTVTDDVGVRHVRVSIREQSSQLWVQADGSLGPFAARFATLSNPQAAQSNWTISVSLPPGNYGAAARATDITGQIETDRPWTRFTVRPITTGGPESAVTAPTPGSQLPSRVVLAGSATAGPGVVVVRVAVRDRQTGQWLQPAGTFTPTFSYVPALLDATGDRTVSWTLEAELPAARYLMIVRAVGEGRRVERTPATVKFEVVGASPIKFRAIADVPYVPAELAEMQVQIPLVPLTESFLVHLGDIKSGADKACGVSYYRNVREVLLSSPIPAHIIPGDNEWNDCTDPDAAWQRWQQHFGDLDEHFSGPAVQRQEIRPENFSFIENDVAFIGINMVGGRVLDADDWAARYTDDAAWIDRVLSENPTVTSAVIFGHGFPVSELVAPIAAFDKPVLYLMGDFHRWVVDTPYPAMAPQLTRVVLDRSMPGASVTVTHDRSAPWIFDRSP